MTDRSRQHDTQMRNCSNNANADYTISEFLQVAKKKNLIHSYKEPQMCTVAGIPIYILGCLPISSFSQVITLCLGCCCYLTSTLVVSPTLPKFSSKQQDGGEWYAQTPSSSWNHFLLPFFPPFFLLCLHWTGWSQNLHIFHSSKRWLHNFSPTWGLALSEINKDI